MNEQESNDHSWVDPVIQMLTQQGTPVTRENYLALAYPFGMPEEWTAELESMLPEELQYHEAVDEHDTPASEGSTDAAPMSAPQALYDGLTAEQLQELIATARRKPKEGEDEEDDLEAVIAGEKLRRLRIRMRVAAARKPDTQASFAIRSPGLLALKEELLEKGMSEADAEAYLRTL